MMSQLKLVGKKAEQSVFDLAGLVIGGKEIVLMGGPCAVESREQMIAAAETVRHSGGKVLRGGVFKPRTSPYSFQGLGEKGIDYLVQAAKDNNLMSVTEVIDTESLKLVQDKVDIIQIGARNMQNFQLLIEVGKVNKPVILKRGLAATVEEWLLAAEYILASGNPHVILCERGIRTYEPSTRNTLDLSAVVVAKQLSHLPVIVDPSHAAGRTDLIPALAKAAIAAGADGLLIETHPNPAEAKSDGGQSLTLEQFWQLATELVKVAESVGRTFAGPVKVQESLQSLRAEIDAVDADIVGLLAKRMKVVNKVAEHKTIDRIKDANREREVVERLSRLAQSLQCPPDLVKEIYNIVFDYGVKSQLHSKITVEGNVSEILR